MSVGRKYPANVSRPVGSRDPLQKQTRPWNPGTEPSSPHGHMTNGRDGRRTVSAATTLPVGYPACVVAGDRWSRCENEYVCMFVRICAAKWRVTARFRDGVFQGGDRTAGSLLRRPDRWWPWTPPTVFSFFYLRNETTLVVMVDLPCFPIVTY